jgi:hypothetical protein
MKPTPAQRRRSKWSPRARRSECPAREAVRTLRAIILHARGAAGASAASGAEFAL